MDFNIGAEESVFIREVIILLFRCVLESQIVLTDLPPIQLEKKAIISTIWEYLNINVHSGASRDVDIHTRQSFYDLSSNTNFSFAE